MRTALHMELRHRRADLRRDGGLIDGPQHGINGNGRGQVNRLDLGYLHRDQRPDFFLVIAFTAGDDANAASAANPKTSHSHHLYASCQSL